MDGWEPNGSSDGGCDPVAVLKQTIPVPDLGCDSSCSCPASLGSCQFSELGSQAFPLLNIFAINFFSA